jgi:hypothetical protein
MRVIVREVGGIRTFELKGNRLKAFEHEFKRVMKFPGKKGEPSGETAPDCTVEVREGKKKYIYALYSRAILFEAKQRKLWQFYFGLLIVEWLWKV